MNKSSTEKSKDFKEYDADAIIFKANDRELQLTFGKLKDVKAGLDGGETLLCQINLPISLLNSFPQIPALANRKDGLFYQLFIEEG